MADDSEDIPILTGGELALADTVILLLKVMSMHGIVDNSAIKIVLSELENRYRAQDLPTAVAMAEYLRRHSAGADHATFIRVHAPAETTAAKHEIHDRT